MSVAILRVNLDPHDVPLMHASAHGREIGCGAVRQRVIRRPPPEITYWTFWNLRRHHILGQLHQPVPLADYHRLALQRAVDQSPHSGFGLRKRENFHGRKMDLKIGLSSDLGMGQADGAGLGALKSVHEN